MNTRYNVFSVDSVVAEDQFTCLVSSVAGATSRTISPAVFRKLCY